MNGLARSQMIKIPLVKPDLPAFATVENGFRELLLSGKITNFGRYHSEFEREIGAFLETNVAIVSSGTTGLILALQASGLPAGGKVILPSFTFAATAQAVLYAGLVPVFAEIGSDLTLSMDDLELLLSRDDEVTAVVPVHMFGLPARVDDIRDLVERVRQHRAKPLRIIYDAAHAFGSALGGRKVGTFGDAEVFSLSATKVLVSVEGGVVSSRNPDFIHRIRRMRNYGMEQGQNARWSGLNGKMSEFHALIGAHNLRRLDELLALRQCKARHYREAIRTATACEIIPWPLDVTHTVKDMAILLPAGKHHARDELVSHLTEAGVETKTYFHPPLHRHELFRRFAARDLPVTEAISERILVLPFYTSITETEIDYVAQCLADACHKVSRAAPLTTTVA
ncbi:MAG TPA: DegT/DnrJ/EryC1/StrS family aminotransferase [Xanthobacteraceae bacterium]|nr:DegT/DnrJ/EryC1/StrS family aminotransferase [Xanthobacteraceae bacterium]